MNEAEEMKKASEVEMARASVCTACPWRKSNQGKRQPVGWYTKANLRRLWTRLRTGDGMTCHPTDTSNPVPPGFAAPAPGTQARECTGSLILQQREMMYAQTHRSWGNYRAARPRGLTREGFGEIVSRYMFGGFGQIGRFTSKDMTLPDLNEADVYYEPLGEWDGDTVQAGIEANKAALDER